MQPEPTAPIIPAADARPPQWSVPGDLSGLPETEAAVTGLRPFCGLRLLAELGPDTLSVRHADAWLDDAVERIRPYVIRTHSTRRGIESVWRHVGDVPASWQIPGRLDALVLHTVAARVGLDAAIVSLPPALGLRVEDLDADYLLSPQDGCLLPVEGEHPRPLRPRSVLAAVVESMAMAGPQAPPAARLRWARVDSALKPGCTAGRVRLAEALLRTGRPAAAYDLSQRLVDGVLGAEASAIRDRAEAELALRN